MSGHCRRRRGGMSLLELQVVMAVMAIVLSTVSAAMLAIYRADLALRDELRSGESVSRLCLRFRADVHAAADAVSGVTTDTSDKSPEHQLLLTLPGGETIEYRAHGGLVERTRSRGRTVEHRDTFLIGDRLRPLWQNAAEGERRYVVMVLRPALDDEAPADSPVRYQDRPQSQFVEATIGKVPTR